jgi:hypothetical protein
MAMLEPYLAQTMAAVGKVMTGPNIVRAYRSLQLRGGA